MKKLISNKKVLKTHRKELRNNATSAEATLWSLIKNKKLKGRKFRRQHSLDNYIVDFYCPAEKLVIELDGENHFSETGIQKDSHRDMFLRSNGFKVLRFENKLIFENQRQVLHQICECFSN